MPSLQLPPLMRRLAIAAILPVALATTVAGESVAIPAQPSQAAAAAPAPAPTQALTLRSDVQEANAKTGVVVARGNVQINYPARQIQATSAQALYFSRERRIVLSGNVYVLQQGNSLRGETITYLIDEGRFVALPEAEKQVESIYLVPDATATPVPAGTPAAPFSSQPEFNGSTSSPGSQR